MLDFFLEFLTLQLNKGSDLFSRFSFPKDKDYTILLQCTAFRMDLFVNRIVLKLYVLPYLYGVTLDLVSSVHLVSGILCSSLQWVTKNKGPHQHLRRGDDRAQARVRAQVRVDRCITISED